MKARPFPRGDYSEIPKNIDDIYEYFLQNHIAGQFQPNLTQFRVIVWRDIQNSFP